MKERFIVASWNEETSKFEPVIWFEKKEDAIREAQRNREFYTDAKTLLLKVLNIPSIAKNSIGDKAKC